MTVESSFLKVLLFKFESPPKQSIMFDSPFLRPPRLPFQVTTTLCLKNRHGFIPRRFQENQRESIDKKIQTEKTQVLGPVKIFRDTIHNETIYSHDPMILPQQYDYVCDVQLRQHQLTNDQKLIVLTWNPPFGSNYLKRYKCPQQSYLSVGNVITPMRERYGYKLSLGDVIKIGVIRLVVTEMKKSCFKKPQFLDRCAIEEEYYDNEPVEDQDGNLVRYSNSVGAFEKQYGMDIQVQQNQGQARLQNQQTISFDKIQSNTKETIQEQIKQCKICLQGDEQQPFISPCDCKGTSQYVHFSCLQDWTKKQTKIQMENYQNRRLISHYRLSHSQCEVCKKILPHTVKKQIDFSQLLPFDRPRCPYMILERLGGKKRKYRDIYILKGGSQQEIKIGRHRTNTIVFKNLTVSKFHSSISFFREQFFIKDEDSKLGTLVRLRKQTCISAPSVSVQIGSCLFEFEPIQDPVHENQHSELSMLKF